MGQASTACIGQRQGGRIDLLLDKFSWKAANIRLFGQRVTWFNRRNKNMSISDVGARILTQTRPITSKRLLKRLGQSKHGRAIV